MGEGPIFSVSVGKWIWFGFGCQRLGPEWPLEIAFYFPFLLFSWELKKKTTKNNWLEVFGKRIF